MYNFDKYGNWTTGFRFYSEPRPAIVATDQVLIERGVYQLQWAFGYAHSTRCFLFKIYSIHTWGSLQILANVGKMHFIFITGFIRVEVPACVRAHPLVFLSIFTLIN